MYLGDHHEIKHHFYRLKYTELNEIYIFNSLRSLAFTFIVIFIPIYLLSLGFSISTVFLYYTGFYLIEAVTEFLTARMIIKFGPKHVIISAVPFFILHFFLMQNIEKYNFPLWLVAITGAIGIGLFWQAYHYDFSKSKRRGCATSDVSKQYLLVYFLAIFAPFIGGYLADNFGPSVTFMVVIVILLFASTFLFKTKEKHIEETKIDLVKVSIKEIRKDLLAYAGRGWEVFASMIIWPIFIFNIVGSYRGLGLITSVSIIASMTVIYFVGKKSDKSAMAKKKYIVTGSTAKSIVGVGKIFVASVLGVYVVNILGSIVGSFVSSPWDSEYYLHADEESRNEYIMIMEIMVDLSRALVACILFTVSIFLPINTVLVIGLIIGALGALAAAAMPLSKSEIKLCKEDFKIMPQPQPAKSPKSEANHV